jgi:hypothetical protein
MTDKDTMRRRIDRLKAENARLRGALELAEWSDNDWCGECKSHYPKHMPACPVAVALGSAPPGGTGTP